jgi:hypothetical protein
MPRELLLGDNAFTGVSHLSQGKARMESREATLENIVKVIEASVDSGATGFTFSTHPKNLELLTYLHDSRRDLLEKLNYYPLTPYVHPFLKRMGDEGPSALLRTAFLGAFKERSSLMQLVSAVLSMDTAKLVGVVLESDVSPFLQMIPRNQLRAVFLHELVTEMVIAFRMESLVKGLDVHMKKRTGASFGLETRNLGQLHDFVRENHYVPEFVMTPINGLGYQMAPDKETAEIAVVGLGQSSKIIAMNILASGALAFQEALAYISRFRNSLYGIVTATTKPERARDNFKMLAANFVS